MYWYRMVVFLVLGVIVFHVSVICNPTIIPTRVALDVYRYLGIEIYKYIPVIYIYTCTVLEYIHVYVHVYSVLINTYSSTRV